MGSQARLLTSRSTPRFKNRGVGGPGFIVTSGMSTTAAKPRA
jgi:hypothetical protein